MQLKIIISHQKIWQKDIAHIPKTEVLRIIEKISELKNYPWNASVHVKQLQSYNLADFRLRVGNYRILFNLDLENQEVLLLRVLHRSKLY